jgi:hypothetical protein
MKMICVEAVYVLSCVVNFVYHALLVSSTPPGVLTIHPLKGATIEGVTHLEK